MTYINPKRAWTGAFVPNWLAWRTEVTAICKLIYARMCQYADDDGVAWPKQETLALELGIQLRTAQRGLTDLQNAGLLTSEQRGKGRSNLYRFPFHPWMKANSPNFGTKSGENHDTTDLSGHGDDMTDLSGPDTTDLSGPIGKEHSKTTKEQQDAPAKRKPTKLKEGWRPSAVDRQYAEGRGFNTEQIDDIAADFETYWTLGAGRNKTHLDWGRCWQSWVRRERPRSGAPRGEAGQRAGHLRLVEGATRPDPFGVQK